ncbi:hypothetical protein E2C01_096834 [Portunus trituberculatus]|uniref:Uncharacterized protein n=1 Tax=Portunus trituberculatus TaxID=210409 RepID=A0A5B7K3Y2_PORTR|nr:hypothetical protein [Portunus trituberculatus]
MPRGSARKDDVMLGSLGGGSSWATLGGGTGEEEWGERSVKGWRGRRGEGDVVGGLWCVVRYGIK